MTIMSLEKHHINTFKYNNMPELYTKEWFIEKFEAIPDHLIGQRSLPNHCALHHVGMGIVNGVQTGDYCDAEGNWYMTEETKAFVRLFGGREGWEGNDCNLVYFVNDGDDNVLGTTPKERILTKLRSL